MSPTTYLSISPLQDVFELGLDDAAREQAAFNAVCLKRPSDTFLQEVMAELVAAGVGVENVTLFASGKAVLPDPQEQPLPILHFKATGGTSPVGTHNDGAGAYRRPGLQVVAHAATYPAAYALAQRAFGALLGIRNKAVSA